MKKIILIMLLLVTVIAFPVKVNAIEINNSNRFIQIAENPKNMNEGYQEQTCNGDNSILGSVNDPNSVAWLLQKVFDYIKILGPILVVVISSVDFAKVIINSDDEAMTKAQKKLIIRILLASCLFFIPTLVGVALNLFGITSDATCGLQ